MSKSSDLMHLFRKTSFSFQTSCGEQGGRQIELILIGFCFPEKGRVAETKHIELI